MAARKRNWVDPKTREKIQATQIVNRLQNFVLGKLDAKSGKPIEMSPSQVKAAQVLLAKKMPDLSASDINLTDNTPDNREEVFERLCKVVGREKALELAPEFAQMEKSSEKAPEGVTIQ